VPRSRTLDSPRPLHSAGIVLVRFHDIEPLYLLLRAYRYWDFPKGLTEPNETLLETAKREVREETGLSDLRFSWGKQSYETEPYGGKIAHYFLAESPAGEPALRALAGAPRPEHHEYQWLCCAEALLLLVPRVQRVLAWAHAVVMDSRAKVLM
jgi:8-oxo-dGTP pyrophosphatase MutT (NUDIX family)